MSNAPVGQKGCLLMKNFAVCTHGREWVCLFCVLLLCPALSACGPSRTERLLIQSEEEPSPSPAEDLPGPSEGPEEPSPQPAQEEMIYIDVAGAVLRPGVYGLPEGSRVFMAIDAAGGLTADAAAGLVNKAMALTDGEQVYIPTLTEAAAPPSQGGIASFPALSSKQPDGRIDINSADENLLTQVNGIGPAKAQAIIAYRQEHGPFSAIEDIQKVSGIGSGTYEKIKEQIKVE